MNLIDKSRLMLEAEIDNKISDYLKNFDKKVLDKFSDKLAQGYKVGIKFNGADSFSDIKAAFDLWDPFNKQDVKEYRVANIKSAKEAREVIRNKEKIPPEPQRKDYEAISLYDQAHKRWETAKALVMVKRGKPGYKTEYDANDYPKELKTNRMTMGKVSGYVEEASKVNLADAFKTQDEKKMKEASDELINITEKTLASVKVFSFSDFKKHPEKGSIFEKVLKNYEAAKKNPTDFKTLMDLKRAMIGIKRQGTHTDTATAVASIANKELYDNPTGRTDVDRNIVAAGADSAVGDLSTVAALDMNVPADVDTLRTKVAEMLKDMGLAKKGGKGGFQIINVNNLDASKNIDIKKHFLGGDRDKNYDPETESDPTQLYPSTPEEKRDFNQGLLNVKKLINWFPVKDGTYKSKEAKEFKDIPNEEIKELVLDIKKNGILTLISLKNKVTAPNTKSGVVDKVGNEVANIKKDIEMAKAKRVVRVVRPAPTGPAKPGLTPEQLEAIKRARGK